MGIDLLVGLVALGVMVGVPAWLFWLLGSQTFIHDDGSTILGLFASGVALASLVFVALCVGPVVRAWLAAGVQ